MPLTSMTPVPTDEQQEKLLDEALGIVKVQAFHMKCCLDKGKLMEALKHASNMLSELRTSLLSPKAYYELYMAVTDQLRHLEMYLLDEFGKGRKLADLYELVQYAGNIIPRLYLLITVGLVYMKTTIGCRRDVLRDLVEMCRGVQHPLRGLFLRNYLLQSCRNVLPDVVSEEVTGTGDSKEEHSGTVNDSVDFILLNFAEMNKLWVRMQHQGHSSMRDKRERERQDLRLLVGTNLVRLSQLESIDDNFYKNVVLSGLLEQIVSCRDAIAQEYLMECLIQVFPDEFHLKNLQPFLHSCGQLVPTVNVKTIIIALIDRLAASKDIQLPDDLFDIFSEQISLILKSRPELPLEDVICMQGSLVNFAIKKIPDDEKRNQSIDAVLAATLTAIKDKCPNQVHFRTNIGKELLKFLKLPVAMTPNSPSGVESIKMSLKLTNYKSILKETADIELQKQVTLLLLNSALESGLDDKVDPKLRLTQQEIETFLSQICDPLINGPKLEDGEEQDEDFIDEQVLLSRFLHYLLSPLCLDEKDLDTQYLVVSSARKILSQGGPKRMRHTLPSLVFEALRLSLRYSELSETGEDPQWHKKCSKIFDFIFKTISALMKDCNCPEVCLRLFLQAGISASKSGLENRESLAYEYISHTFSIYEDEISDSKEQLSCLILMIGAIREIGFESEDHSKPLRRQCCLNGAKLVKKSDQCRAILSASLLFVDDADGRRKCIKKAIDISSSIQDQEVQLQLLVEILSHLTLFLPLGASEIEETVQKLVDRINDQREKTTMSQLTERQYCNTLNVLKDVVGQEKVNTTISSLNSHRAVVDQNHKSANNVSDD